MKQSLSTYLVLTTLIAGLLDITAACFSAWIISGTNPSIVLKYIASGVFGRRAFLEQGMVMAGLVFHFLIVFSCVIVFFLAYGKFFFLKKNLFLNAILIAFVAWTATTIIIHFSQISPQPFTVSGMIRAILILFFCIGLPISFSTAKYYRHHNKEV